MLRGHEPTHPLASGVAARARTHVSVRAWSDAPHGLRCRRAHVRRVVPDPLGHQREATRHTLPMSRLRSDHPGIARSEGDRRDADLGLSGAMTARSRGGQAPKSPPLGRPVLIVSRNAATIDGLQTYLSAAVVTRSALAVEDLLQRLSSGPALSCVFFPDDYAKEQIEATIEAIRTGPAGSTVVLVTRSPQRFDGRLDARVWFMPRTVSACGRRQPDSSASGWMTRGRRANSPSHPTTLDTPASWTRRGPAGPMQGWVVRAHAPVIGHLTGPGCRRRTG